MGRRDKLVPVDGRPEQIIGATLRYSRQARGVSLGEMALRASYTKGYLSAVETGCTWPSRDLLETYEKILDLPAGDLLRVAGSLASARAEEPLAGAYRAVVQELLIRAREGLGELARVLTSPASQGQAADSTAERRSLIRGYDEILRFATELVAQAGSETTPTSGEILITYQGRGETFSRESAADEPWRTAVIDALRTGWDVVHVCQLGRLDETARLRLVTDMLDLFGYAGRYRPYSLPADTGVTTPYEILIVPGRHGGALVFITTQNGRCADAAFFCRDPEYVDVLRRHCAALLSMARPMITAHGGSAGPAGRRLTRLDQLRFDVVLTLTETSQGHRTLVKDGLSTHTLPTELWEERAMRLRDQGEEWAEWVWILADNRRRRRSAFIEQLVAGQWSFRDICTKRAIELLVRDGIVAPDDSLLAPAPGGSGDRPAPHRLSPAERSAHLQEVIRLLETYPTYEIAFLDDEEAGEITRNWWLVKTADDEEAGILLMETWQALAGERVEIDLEIAEPAVVAAFHDHFAELWDAIPAANREKESVIAWLRAQLNHVPRTQEAGAQETSRRR